ncbi:hypothetical protein C8Q80DRAFT_1117302 [Daedaleopsis nitida]|nr:hypothetical protein C8Q80DRAFT_1117302 [Daedaleopsis nitida]
MLAEVAGVCPFPPGSSWHPPFTDNVLVTVRLARPPPARCSSETVQTIKPSSTTATPTRPPSTRMGVAALSAKAGPSHSPRTAEPSRTTTTPTRIGVAAPSVKAGPSHSSQTVEPFSISTTPSCPPPTRKADAPASAEAGPSLATAHTLLTVDVSTMTTTSSRPPPMHSASTSASTRRCSSTCKHVGPGRSSFPITDITPSGGFIPVYASNLHGATTKGIEAQVDSVVVNKAIGDSDVVRNLIVDHHLQQDHPPDVFPFQLYKDYVPEELQEQQDVVQPHARHEPQSGLVEDLPGVLVGDFGH